VRLVVGNLLGAEVSETGLRCYEGFANNSTIGAHGTRTYQISFIQMRRPVWEREASASKLAGHNGTGIMNFKRVLQVCCITVLLVLAFVALGPAKWQPRSGLGWEIDHFAGYFVITVMCCIAWPRPLVLGGALVIFAVVLEGLQAFMPDRSSYYLAAVYSAAGVIAAALIADLFIRARRWVSKRV